MSYDPVTYWTDAGRNPGALDHESKWRRTPVFARQEAALMRTLEGLEFGSVLEVGCGWGRVTKLVHDRWPTAQYNAIDLSAERVASAKRQAPGVDFWVGRIQDFSVEREGGAIWDLVLCVETLMHVPPADIKAVVGKVLALASRYVVSVDWAVPIKGEIAPWNTLHDYAALYGDRLRSVEQTDQQAIYVVDAT